MESIGGFGKDCDILINHLAHRLKDVLYYGKSAGFAAKKIRQRLSVIWQCALGFALHDHACHLTGAIYAKR